jgi:dTDP-4-amino-4,6-dideoxygalactose transaminase
VIPQTDPRANYLAHKLEIDDAIARVLDHGRYILGPEVEAFEQEFAQWLGVRHVVSVASGTDALRLALESSGVGPGDAVTTVSHTAVATVTAIELAGAVPRLVDIDPVTFTIDCNLLEDALRSGRVRAIVPVHLYGHPANLRAIMALANRSGTVVIEDCAQSHGASIENRKTGTFGKAAAFSFYPTKNLGALGDGGAIATNDDGVAERARGLREYGWKQRYVSDVRGMNSRLDELQAAILRVKLRYLDAGNARRREIAETYSTGLRDSGLRLPKCAENVTHAWHQYVIRSQDRDALRAKLTTRGVGTLVHYPVPVHLQPAYQRLEHAALVETESAAREVLSLPMYPELSNADVASVIEALGGRKSEASF